MKLELKKFGPSEYEMFAQIRNSIFVTNPVSSEELKAFDDSFDKTKYYRQRYSCFDSETGRIIGFGNIGHLAWAFDPQRFIGTILVDPVYQNKGVGQFIYEKLLRYLAELHAQEILASAKEDMPVSMAFLVNRGFKEIERTWESNLDPGTVNVSAFSRYLEKASEAGVKISSLSKELVDDPECYRKLYELNMTLMADVPTPRPRTVISYDQWLSFDMKDQSLIPDAYLIAKHGSDYVGLSTVRRLGKDPHGLHQMLTGVRREYRGKGVAFAMKLKLVEHAQKNGYSRIRTENSTSNKGMLDINTKLGFKKGPVWTMFSKTLS